MKGIYTGERPEILAPAGAAESVYAAVRCGADAVYLGGGRFSARANAANFSAGEIEEAVNYCHLHNVKVYQTLNTLIFDSELRDLLEAAKLSAKIGVDAFIVQDIGAAAMLREAIPDIKLNASTQMSVHTKKGALLAKEMGFSRVVLARELSLSQIEEISAADIETEVFIHGALCMSVSGQCYMSALIGSRSANRGLCAQACRLPFSAVPDEERCDLSLKDLSLTEHIEKLKKAGVRSLKIEGRMKRAEYVAAAVTAVRAAVNGEKPDTDTLRAVFSRSGFTDGYLTEKLGSGMFGIRRKEDVVSAEAVLPKLRELYHKETKALPADFHAVIKKGVPSELEMTAENITVKASGNIPEEAHNRPANEEILAKQLSKLGDSPYSPGKITAEIDGGLSLSASQINALRREAVNLMNAARIAAKKHDCAFKEPELDIIEAPRKKSPAIRAKLENLSQLGGVESDTSLIILPLEEIIKAPAKLSEYKEKLCAELPRFTIDEPALEEKLSKLKEIGINKILCTNIAHIKTGRELGFEMHGGFGLNITNSLSLKKFAELGLSDAAVSFEMKLAQINRLGGYLPYGIIAYGRLPAMLTRNCPIKQAVGSCKSCTHELTDRTNRKFPVRCKKDFCEILNSDILVMSDRLSEINADFIELDFYEETAEEIKRVFECFAKNEKIGTENMTRGLYYRGVI